MKIPLFLIGVRVSEEQRTKFRIRLPLFLLWPLLLMLALLALVVAAMADGALILIGEKHGYARLVLGCLEVMGESRGVEIRVRDKRHTVAVTVD